MQMHFRIQFRTKKDRNSFCHRRAVRLHCTKKEQSFRISLQPEKKLLLPDRHSSRRSFLKQKKDFPHPQNLSLTMKWVRTKRIGWGTRSEERRVGKECRSRWSP